MVLHLVGKLALGCFVRSRFDFLHPESSRHLPANLTKTFQEAVIFRRWQLGGRFTASFRVTPPLGSLLISGVRPLAVGAGHDITYPTRITALASPLPIGLHLS